MNQASPLSAQLRLQTVTFWRDWPPGRQRVALYLLLALTALGIVMIWAWLFTATLRAAERETRAMERHRQVSGLVTEIRGLERTTGPEQTNLPILLATRQLSRDIGLEEKLISVRPALQAAGRDGVQLYFERLTLPDLLSLLEALQRDGGLQTSTVTFNRRLDDPSLADMQLVLHR
ncbi:type II secretion system protein GspM [Desulfonatronum thioautotrophicum]|uniref:type II secretion system protein GspM n=1 Tax=Desulfonatronum thioautotrophicum TaxID=617001 RepID=UPI0005EB47B4|nr:type II secretion system protein GspM [Desulfonatronum thioautotrophicum]